MLAAIKELENLVIQLKQDKYKYAKMQIVDLTHYRSVYIKHWLWKRRLDTLKGG